MYTYSRSYVYSTQFCALKVKLYACINNRNYITEMMDSEIVYLILFIHKKISVIQCI